MEHSRGVSINSSAFCLGFLMCVFFLIMVGFSPLFWAQY